MAVSRRRQPQFFGRSTCVEYLAFATGPPTSVGTCIHSGQLVRRLRIWLSPFWESACAWCMSHFMEVVGLRPTDQNCHPETKIHLYFVDWSNSWSKQKVHRQCISVKERTVECSCSNPKRCVSEIMSDHSLPS